MPNRWVVWIGLIVMVTAFTAFFGWPLAIPFCAILISGWSLAIHWFLVRYGLARRDDPPRPLPLKRLAHWHKTGRWRYS